MKSLIIVAALLSCIITVSADTTDAVTKDKALKAFREYRTAVKLISIIHSDLMRSTISTDSKEEFNIPKKDIESYKRARKHLEESIKLNPYFPEAYVYLANSYWEIENDLEKVVTYYSKALELDPEYAEVVSARGHVLTQLGRVKEAGNDLNTLVRLESEFTDSLRKDIAVAKAKKAQEKKPEPSTDSEYKL